MILLKDTILIVCLDLEYLSNIYKIQDAKLNELIIIITEEEINSKKENYAAFDLSKMEIVQ